MLKRTVSGQQVQVFLLLASTLSIGYAAESIVSSVVDVDNLPLITKWSVVLYALIGWGSAELDSLADLVNRDAKTRLGVGKKFLAAMAAGLLTGFGFITFTDWPRIVAYAMTFLAAFGGAAYVDTLAKGLAESLKSFMSRVFNTGGK